MSNRSSIVFTVALIFGMLLFSGCQVELEPEDKPDIYDPWKFIVYGDSRTFDDFHRSVLQSIVANTPDYEMIYNVGDLVGTGYVTAEWETWQTACDDILGGTGQDNTPPLYMAAPGNHDMTDLGIVDSTLINWKNYLWGQDQLYGNDGLFFVVDYKNVRVIVLNSCADPESEQLEMLMDAIQNNSKTWLFAIWHHPIFDFGPKHYEDLLHRKWGVPLYTGGCDIIFTGHAHYYVRTAKLGLDGEQNPPLDPNSGAAQIVTGNGGAGLYGINPDEDGNGYMVESYTNEHYGYTELTVEEDSLSLRHILADGTVFDETVYTPNQKVDE